MLPTSKITKMDVILQINLIYFNKFNLQEQIC